jgi:hypothetical protein
MVSERRWIIIDRRHSSRVNTSRIPSTENYVLRAEVLDERFTQLTNDSKGRNKSKYLKQEHKAAPQAGIEGTIICLMQLVRPRSPGEGETYEGITPYVFSLVGASGTDRNLGS